MVLDPAIIGSFANTQLILTVFAVVRARTPHYFAELRLPNMEMTVEQCVDALIRLLENGGILTGGPSDPSGLPMPDGDEIIDLHVDPRLARLSCWSTAPLVNRNSAPIMVVYRAIGEQK